MFNRTITKYLLEWKGKKNRKPLGQISEQAAGQALLSLGVQRNVKPHYWYREQKGATSEIDYLTVLRNRLVPIEVKSGKTGTLRSLHNFMEESKSAFAVRVYSGNMNRETITTANKKKYTLLSIPFYLLFRIGELV